MKRYLLSVFFILTGLMLVACGGGGGSAGTPSGSASPTNFKVNAPAEVTLALGQTVSYAITGGLTPYTVTNSAPGFVNATVSGQTLTVTAVKVGTSVLSVSPQGGGATATINLTVVSGLTSLQVQAPDKITLRPGTSGTYLVSGGTPPYRAVSSNSSVVSASIVGENLRLDGAGVGTSEVQIFDSTGSAPVKREVDVIVAAALFSSAPSSLTLSTGGTRSYSIGGGVAPYTAVSSDESVVQVSLAGTSLSVSGLVGGTSNVIIRDATGSTITISVKVGSATNFFTTAPSALTIQVNTSRTFSISGGSAPYSATSADTSVATATVNGSSLTITAQGKGTALVNIGDSTGAVIPLTITVLQSFSSVPTVIDVTTSSNTLNSAGAEAVITAFVKGAGNVGISGQAVLFTSSSGSLIAPDAQTDASGVAKVRLSPGSDKSNRDIIVTASIGTVSGSVTVAVTGTRLVITGGNSLQAGAPRATYSVRAVDSAGNPIAGASLTATSLLGNGITGSPMVTDASGNASFFYSPSVAGTETLTVSGLGTKATTPIDISAINLSVVSPAANTSISVGSLQLITVRYLLNGVPVPGKTVDFSSTRGNFDVNPASVVTNANGDASISIASPSAGPALISAQIAGVGSVSHPLQFIATTPATISLQANPGALPPNFSGNVNQSTLEATVRDAAGNAVANKQVNFTIIRDLSNGSLSTGNALTDANGRAQVQFISGASSTSSDGVVVQAQVAGTTISATAALTVSGNSLFITIGFGNEVGNVDQTTYSKLFSVYVTDANGVAVGNQNVTLVVIPSLYYKGILVKGTEFWEYAPGSPTVVCPNEDLNLNGIFDAGEDINGDSRLTPGNIAVSAPGSVITDPAGRATFALQYGEQFAPWATVNITARTTVSGTESRRTISYALNGLIDDFKIDKVPAGANSPFGQSAVCTDTR